MDYTTKYLLGYTIMKTLSKTFLRCALFGSLLPFIVVNAQSISSSKNKYANIPPQSEQAKLVDYVSDFPYDLYTVCTVENQEKFYIDDPQDSIKYWLTQGQAWEPYIVDLLKHYIKPDSCVVDAGAHIGTHTIVMAHSVGKNGRVVAFEPQLKIYRELVMNARLNNCPNIDCYRCAIGNEHKTIEMNKSVAGFEGGTGIGAGGDIVEMHPLDSFNLQNVSLMKVDVEGSEDAFLDGATNTILQNRPIIIIEIQGGWDYDTAPQNIRDNITRTKDKLDALNYTVKKVSPHDYLAIPMNLSR